MELEQAKKLIKKYAAGHSQFVRKADVAERYYKNRNDILFLEKNREEKEEKEENPLRNADNRISHNFHGLLVNQKASYMFTYPPLFDVGMEGGSKKVAEILGDKFPKICKSLCVSASNNSVAWIHYWIDKEKRFRYGVVDSRQVIPVWTEDLDRELKAVLRTYEKVMDDGKIYIIYEIWTEKECQAFCREENNPMESLLYYSIFDYCIIDLESEEAKVYFHNFGRVPFIPFFNNEYGLGDLDNVKPLIDTYDRVFSGFFNDLEDIQEVIFVLSGYGGTDLAEFLGDLKKYKTVKLDEEEGKPGLSTITIDIPVEAREKMLTMTRKEIFEQGQGVDPQPENYGNASGEALKFMYSLLELKAGLMETEFRIGFGEFIRAICGYLGISCEKVEQTWTRNRIRNEAELSNICSQSSGIISQETIVKNHPFVTDYEKELKRLEKEEKEEQEKAESQYNPFRKMQQDKTGLNQNGGEEDES